MNDNCLVCGGVCTVSNVYIKGNKKKNENEKRDSKDYSGTRRGYR
jgi:hypothetical protein